MSLSIGTILWISSLFFSLYGLLTTSACSKYQLKQLDVSKCLHNISNQYPWRWPYQGMTPPSDVCDPMWVFLLEDISKTVRRSSRKENTDVDMSSLQALFSYKLLTQYFVNETEDSFAYIPYATSALLFNWFSPHIDMDTGFDSDAEEWDNFITSIQFFDEATTQDPFLRKYFRSRGRGWSSTSKVLKTTQNVLEYLQYSDAWQRYNTSVGHDATIFLMTDGRPESPGGIEMPPTRRAIEALKSLPHWNVHVHCLQMRMGEKAKDFWVDDRVCDSKSYMDTVSSVISDVSWDSLDFLKKRKEFCGTPAPTMAPTTACDRYTGSSTELDLDFENADITINNLGGFCGMDAEEGVQCGDTFPQVLRFDNIAVAGERTVHLVISNVTEYNTRMKDSISNPGQGYYNIGRNGKFGIASLRKSNNVTFKFSFIEDDGSPVVLESLDFTVFDLDQEECSCADCACANCDFREKIKLDKGQFDGTATTLSVFQSSNSVLCDESTPEEVVILSTVEGDSKDNPSDPQRLSAFAESVSVTFRFELVSSFELTYEIQNGDPEGGRSLQFAGSSNLSPC